MNEGSKYADLTPRIASAIVLIGIAAVGFAAGGIWAALLIAVVSMIMLWEFARLTRFNAGYFMPVMVATGAISILITWQTSAWVGMLILVVGMLALYRENRREWALSALGLAYVGGAALAIYTIYVGANGIWNLFWVILVVVLSDIGGYFAGRTFGGPKLWPAISPKKTWSGTLGGWGLAVVGGIIIAIFTPYQLFFAILVSLVLCIAAQAGDLLESWVKRKQGVKDASNLIPGHGGFLDRFDALMAAALIFLALPGV